MGVDKHLLIRFNKGFSELSAASFINQILIQKIGVKHCFIGDDFRFGKGRLGGFSMLKAASHENNYTIEKLNSVLLDGLRVSSSAVRNFLTDGNSVSYTHLTLPTTPYV